MEPTARSRALDGRTEVAFARTTAPCDDAYCVGRIHTRTPALAIAAKAERGLCGAGLAKEFVFGGSGFGSVTDSRDRQERGPKYGQPQSITFFQESLRKKFFQSS